MKSLNSVIEPEGLNVYLASL